MKNADAVWPERLKFLRKSNNLSQTDVAGVLHCSQAAYGMYELGKRKISADKLLILAQYYHVSVDYLVGLRDEVCLKKQCRFMICTAFLLWLKDLVHMVETSLFSEFVEKIILLIKEISC